MTSETTTRFDGIEACVFDAYGTLFDVHSAVAQCRDRYGLEAGAASTMSDVWRTKQLQYTWLRALMGAKHHVDFWQVTGEALDFALDTAFKDTDPPEGLRQALMDSYLTLHTYPEVPHVLKQLKDGGMNTAILSNGAPEMLGKVCDSTGIASVLDAVLSVGRPAAIRLVVLVDRGHRQLPIRADHVGKNLPTSLAQHVTVHVTPVDDEDAVVVDDARDAETEGVR